MDLTLLLDAFGLFLTLCIFLYLFFGDNGLFRLVTYLFIGVVSGYIFVLIIFNVLIPRIASLVFSNSPALLGVGIALIVLALLLVSKLFPRFSRVGSLPMAVLVGVGAAVAIGGAVFGTLFGQAAGTFALFNLKQKGSDLLAGIYLLVGVISTLVYFQFSTRSRPTVAPDAEEGAIARRASSLEVLARLGQVFIGITLGAVFAGVYTAAITAMVERLGFIFDTVINILTYFKLI